jgi:hypothetical protein
VARTAVAAALAGLALWSADRIVARIHHWPFAGWLALVLPAALIALAIEVVVSDHATQRYSWRRFGSEVGGAVFAILVVLFAALRLGEPVFTDPAPWAVISLAVIPFSAAVGYGHSLWLAARSPRDPSEA